MDSKSFIRHRLLAWRKALDPKDREGRDRRIAVNLESLGCFRDARHVLFYYSVAGEADTRRLIDRWIGKKQLCLPVCDHKGDLHATPIAEPIHLEKGIEGIPEPRPTKKRLDDRIDLVIVPGVAFDKGGNRLGMGKGYYDRYLKIHPKAIRVALAYEEQMLDGLPCGDGDVPVHFVVTEKGVYNGVPA